MEPLQQIYTGLQAYAELQASFDGLVKAVQGREESSLQQNTLMTVNSSDYLRTELLKKLEQLDIQNKLATLGKLLELQKELNERVVDKLINQLKDEPEQAELAEEQVFKLLELQKEIVCQLKEQEFHCSYSISQGPPTSLKKHTDCVLTLIPGREKNQFISGSLDLTVRLWSYHNPPYHNLSYRNPSYIFVLAEVHSLVCLKNGTIASGCGKGDLGYEDYAIKLWGPKAHYHIHSLKGHNDVISDLKVMEDETLVSCSLDKTIKLWDVTKRVLKQSLEEHNGPIRALLILRNGTLVSGAEDNTIKLWNLHTGRSSSTIQTYAPIFCLKLFRDGTFASGCGKGVLGYEDYAVKLWNEEGVYISSLSGHQDSVLAIEELPNDSIASASSDGTIKLWDRSSGRLQHTLKPNVGPICSLAVLEEDGTLLSGSQYGTIHAWKNHTAKPDVLKLDSNNYNFF